jgi:Amidohydrolase
MKQHVRPLGFGCAFVVSFVVGALSQDRAHLAPVPEFNDCHLHLTNYIQEGTDIRDFIKLMGAKVGRSTLFGIPLQQQWSFRIDGDRAPAYYLQSDAPLYYYSFTDAWIAMAYRSLSKDQQDKLDPMITGFNPTDMYAVDHVRRVLQTFPGVFSGIGEFTIHKEFVSPKVAGGVASLQDRALDRLLDFVAEVGFVALIHNDLDTPFPKAGAKPAYLDQMTALLKRHPKTTVIWAHTGVGRVVRPIQNHAANLEKLLADPALPNLYFDISWDETAKYIVASPEATKITAALMERYPDRFLFGTDEVAPRTEADYMKVYEIYRPLWNSLSPQTSEKVRKGNYERVFDAARKRVREWEKGHVKNGNAN